MTRTIDKKPTPSPAQIQFRTDWSRRVTDRATFLHINIEDTNDE